jgi:uncharacterized radical SAM superfamily Fe-S cluster-containing enzyme
MTIPDVLKLIEQQTARKFLVGDFIPVPCCFPTPLLLGSGNASVRIVEEVSPW